MNLKVGFLTQKNLKIKEKKIVRMYLLFFKKKIKKSIMAPMISNSKNQR